ncbi:MAG TPA: VanZ family protein [Anaerolineae bacterium]|nr:VanZ family protein [Anaerolineae bacterium]
MNISSARQRAQNLIFKWVPMISWMALIFWLSSQPKLPRPGPQIAISDELVAYAAHAFLFGVLALLVWRVLRDRPHPMLESAARPPLLGTILLSGLYAVTDEVHQLSTPGRQASFADWLADLVGILIAIYLLTRRAKQRGRR